MNLQKIIFVSHFTLITFQVIAMRDSLMLGGSGWIIREKENINFSSPQEIISNHYKIEGVAGYFLSNKFVLGIAGQFNLTTSNNSQSEQYFETKNLNIGPIVRWYTYRLLFIQTGMSYGKVTSLSKVHLDNNEISVRSSKKMGIFGLNAGYDFHISKRFWFEPVLTYSYSKDNFGNVNGYGNILGTSHRLGILLGFIGIIGNDY